MDIAAQIRIASYTLLIFVYGTLANVLFILIALLVSPFSPMLAYEWISAVA